MSSGSSLPYAGLLARTRDAVVVHDLDHRLAFLNASAERLFGVAAEQAVGRSVAEVLGDAAVLQEDAVRELLAGREWMGEMECLDASRQVISVERTCSLLRADDGRQLVMWSCADVTERRRAEKEIVLLSNVMEQRIRRRTAELEESNKDLREFAYSLAHDLRAPLASIDGFSAQLERRLADVLDQKSRHYLNRVRAGVALMSDLTDGLLGLADIANADLMHQAADLSHIARNVLERLRESSLPRDIAVVVNETVPARGDVRLLTDVLQNLLGNAWKFTSKTRGARIEFGGAPTPLGYAYHVKDNGAGFDPEYAYKLFGPFQRLHRGDEFEGTGIGLAIVRKIVTRHGGQVWADAKPGEGAAFYFTLA